MLKTAVNKVVSIFSIVFVIAILLIIIASLLFPDYDWPVRGFFVGNRFHYFDVPAALLLLAVIAVLFFILLMYLFSRMGRRQLRLTAGVLWAMILTAETLIIFFFHGIQPPDFDGGHTFFQAINLLEHKYQADNLQYFQIYPNNVAITVLRYWIYRAFCFGNPAFFIPADQIACAVSLNIGIYFSWKFILSTLNQKTANLFLIMVLTCFPLFFYIVYFYTDSMTLMFPPLLLYLTHRYARTDKIRYIILFSLFLAISFQIRENMILMLPALILYIFLIKNFKKTLICLMISAVLIAGVGFAAQKYENHLGFTKNQALEMPTISWLLMGLSGNGRYNNKDYMLAMRQPTQKQKKDVNLQAIKQRIADRGAIGLSITWAVKAARTFGDGSLAYFWQTNTTTDYSVPYNYIFGHQKQLVIFIIQVFHIALLILLAFSVVRSSRKRKIDENLLIQICLFGSILFYVFVWEAEPRYALLFTLLELVGATYGLIELHDLSAAFMEKVKERRSYFVSALLILLCLSVLTVCVAVENDVPYSQTARWQELFSVDQHVSKGNKFAVVNATHQIEQTFRTAEPFNRVSIGVIGHRGRAVYQITILEKGRKQRYGQIILSSSRIKKRGLETIKIKNNPDQPGVHDYTLSIRRLSGSRGSQLFLGMYGKGLYEQRDIYPEGALYVNGRNMQGIDLQFQVYRLIKRTYMSSVLYGVLFILPLATLMISIYGMIRIFWKPYRRTKLITDKE